MSSDDALVLRVRGERGSNAARFRYEAELALEPGVHVLFGPSAAGKTTILSCIAGLLTPQAGRIALGARVLFDADRGLDVPAHQRRVALVFQSLALFPHLDALANVEYGVPRTLAKAERVERARGWLDRMRVGHLRARRPQEFSGGEAQRVALARALASEPRALLLDEPFSALDQALARALCAELAAHVKASPIPVLLVTHDAELARKMGQSLALMREGRIVATGAVNELLPASE